MCELSIVIVNCGLRGYPGDCLAALHKAPLPDETEIILVHDGRLGSHATNDAADDVGPREIVLKTGASYAAGRNAGLSAARGAFVLLLDADVMVRPDAPETLRQHLVSHARPIAAAAQLLRENGLPRVSARRFPSFFQQVLRIRSLYWRLLYLLRVPPRLPKRRRPPFRAQAPFGCCVMLRRAEALQIGALDEGCAFQFDATDWFWRASRGGFTADIIPAACAFRIPPQVRGPVPAAAFIAHQHGQYRAVRRNRNAVYARVFLLMRLGVWLALGIFSGLAAVLTLFRSKHTVQMFGVAKEVIRWHTKGCAEPAADPDLESTVRWDPLG